MPRRVKFGAQQVANPTPANFERFVKIFIGINGLFLAWMPTNNLVPTSVQEVVTPIVNLLNSILLFLLPYFGVQVEGNKIPVKDVVSMETKPTE
jgi:hypothetical protein